MRGCYSVKVDWSDGGKQLALMEYAVWRVVVRSNNGRKEGTRRTQQDNAQAILPSYTL